MLNFVEIVKIFPLKKKTYVPSIPKHLNSNIYFYHCFSIGLFLLEIEEYSEKVVASSKK